MRTNLFIKTVFFVFVLSLFAFFISCSGDEGPAGPKGEQGERGTQGIPGKDGAVIHSGIGAPAATLGNVGDMYLDISTSNLYGPKSNTGWETPLNLKGETGTTGAAGTPGSKILSGTANPSTSVGAVGDYYLNKTTGGFFGPKTLSGWGTPINLKGTANVVASTWIAYNWNSTNTSTRKVMDYTIPTPLLAAVGYASLYNFSNAGGVILVYGENWGSNNVRLFNYDFRNGRYEASPNTNGSKIYITLTSISSTALIDIEYDGARGNRFRYVLIPAGVQLSGMSAVTRFSHINWNELSYEEVKELLSLKD